MNEHRVERFAHLTAAERKMTSESLDKWSAAGWEILAIAPTTHNQMIVVFQREKRAEQGST